MHRTLTTTAHRLCCLVVRHDMGMRLLMWMGLMLL
jgi:hypothetical protein